ncbi:MAG: hypothetical protein KGV59_07315 [Tenacibaculum sp.]|nr:hypothetical protein [Tenacibaculum sp.]
MAILSWGKPKLEISKLDENGDATTWVIVDTPVENTTKMNVEKGERKEAKEEGGAAVDVRVGKNKYNLEFELYAKKGKSKPIEDEDGRITDNYAIRLTPEDETQKGFVMDNSSVSVEETWDSENGGKWKYSFQGLKPKTGKIVKPYTA